MMDLDFVILLSHQSKNYNPIQLKFVRYPMLSVGCSALKVIYRWEESVPVLK